MFCLLNTDSYKGFVYNPKKEEFTAVGRQVFDWHTRVLGYSTVRLGHITNINAYRKILNTLPREQLEKMTATDATNYMHDNYPEMLI